MILPVGKISKVIRKNMYCKNCAVSYYKNYMKESIVIGDEYDSAIKEEEDEQLFYSLITGLKWVISRRKCEGIVQHLQQKSNRHTGRG